MRISSLQLWFAMIIGYAWGMTAVLISIRHGVSLTENIVINLGVVFLMLGCKELFSVYLKRKDS